MKKEKGRTISIVDWSRFNEIPSKWHDLFLSLANKASSYDGYSPDASQIVLLSVASKTVLKECGWETKDPMYKGLKVLTECGALKKVSRGVYRINSDIVMKGDILIRY